MQEFLNSNTPALHVVATPIGNLEDITLRAITILKNCDFIICEDSRVTSKLLNHLEIKKPFIIYNDHSTNEVREKILNFALQGKKLALVSDAGTPLISDPGYKLVNFLLENNCQILSVPGPCSAIAALSVSGMPSDRFMFAGFIPNSAIARENFLKDLVNIEATLIFFETSNRLSASLETMLKTFGNRTACVSREITKLHEQTKKADLQELINYYEQNPPKGEIVILLSTAAKKGEINLEEIDEKLKQGLNTMKPKDLVSLVADNLGVNKKLVYQRMLELVKEK
ncbi:MAG: Uroporphyrin-III C/tetrapyrrole (Corrin/Porphyrin) methyltransferase [Rickettsiaceae bacterium]|jgi:16S rRNA (cytidine1402-2'-O)-methyltransferase|nr:Uroporphyrin-III C/tetrapyrrole (Corrin/Porphyrin) methyltransferase [Rickettsiaceae bacterium]